MQKKENLTLKLFLLTMFFFLLLPLFFMITGSFQTLNGIMAMPPKIIPRTFTIDNYKALFEYPLALWLFNTFWSLICTILLSVFLSVATGYVFATTNFRYKNYIWSFLLLGMLMPRISMLIPQYIVIKDLKLSGTLFAVILSCSYTSYGTLLARNFFEQIPASLFESAMLDGAGEKDILFNIVVPVSPPAIATLSLSTAIFYLTDYLWQSMVLQKEENQTLMIGLTKSISQFGMNTFGINPFGMMMAVGVILFVPILLVFLVANKYYISAKGGEIKE